MSQLRDFALDLLDVGVQTVAIGAENLDVSIKTNYTPEITIPLKGGDSQSSLLADLIGLKAGLIVRNSRGEIIQTFGEPAAIDPVRVGVLLFLVGGVTLLTIRGIRK